MKKNVLLLSLALVFALASCGGAKEKDKEGEKKPVCEGENSIAITIQDYYYSMNDTLVYSTPDFEIKHSEYNWINDSTVTLKLCNYDPKELSGARQENQIDLNIEINARHGKKLESGYYGYRDYESGLWAGVTMTTAYGTVWFNGNDQGGVTIEHVDKDAICGTLSLNVESPDSPMIGIVRVNGTFVYKK
ncbi:MAG TPA: hypothetical protein PLL66_04840 [Bacteroidales bacterium]|nr:hypothetical protein [Bacteroidales bacterium]